jgi:transposase
LAVPDLNAAQQLATTFRALRLEHQVTQLTPWLERAATASLPEFQALAASLSRDRAAVELAISSQWSSGQVEGQVNRLTLIKLMMYGRGKQPLGYFHAQALQSNRSRAIILPGY